MKSSNRKFIIVFDSSLSDRHLEFAQFTEDFKSIEVPKKPEYVLVDALQVMTPIEFMEIRKYFGEEPLVVLSEFINDPDIDLSEII